MTMENLRQLRQQRIHMRGCLKDALKRIMSSLFGKKKPPQSRSAAKKHFSTEEMIYHLNRGIQMNEERFRRGKVPKESQGKQKKIYKMRPMPPLKLTPPETPLENDLVSRTNGKAPSKNRKRDE